MFVFSWPFFDDFFKTILATSKFFVIYSKVLSLLLLWLKRQRVFHMQCANDETKLVAHLNVVFFYRDKYKNSFLSAEDYILYERACKCEEISMGFFIFLFAQTHRKSAKIVHQKQVLHYFANCCYAFTLLIRGCFTEIDSGLNSKTLLYTVRR